MPYTPTDWRDGRPGGTPMTAAALEAMEARLAAYVDASGGGTQQYTTFNPGQVDFTGTSYISSTDAPDKVTFPVPTGGKLVQAFFQLNAWANNSLLCKLYVDNVLVLDRVGTEVTGDLGAGIPAAAVLTETGGGTGVQIANVGGGFTTPMTQMGTGMPLWLPAGSHTAEVKYCSSTGAPAHISQRRMVVVV